MRYSDEVKLEAVRLRTELSLSLNDICSRLGIAKSTASGWLAGYPVNTRASNYDNPAVQQRRAAAASKTFREKYLKKPFEMLSLGQQRRRVMEEQAHKCIRCGLDEWQGEPLVLELDHKDGNRANNLRENLEGLCPNCHSLTNTWRGRNAVTRVSDADLAAALIQTTSIRKALLLVGLTPRGGNYKRATALQQRITAPLQ